jgi:putative membrane protein
VSASPIAHRLSDRTFYVLNALLSAAALAFLTYILVVRRGGGTGADLSFMPGVNAALNATSATALVAGFVAIKKKRPDIHRALMVSAFVASSLFLIGYVIYHYVHGDTKYAGVGVMRAIYLSILASHVLLSIAVVPLVLTTIFFAARGSFDRHRKVAKVTFPVWLYVSVTGVVVYFMLHG